MKINKPYKRIHRVKVLPAFYDGHTDDYVLDPDYMNVSERHSMVRAVNMLIIDLQKTLDYIEPEEDNLSVYSLRLYELLLRAATEFESNCKGVLLANGYKRKDNKDLNITDYHKLNEVMKLSDYKIGLSFWNSEKIILPLSEWNTGHTLKWYQAYNNVKHNRYNHFKDASLENVLNAIASVICIVYAQLGDYMLQDSSSCYDDSDYRHHCALNGFEITAPSFEEDEYNIMYQPKYDVVQYRFE